MGHSSESTVPQCPQDTAHLSEPTLSVQPTLADELQGSYPESAISWLRLVIFWPCDNCLSVTYREHIPIYGPVIRLDQESYLAVKEPIGTPQKSCQAPSTGVYQNDG